MDWMEKVFGIDLDGGDGSVEFMLVASCAVVLAAVIATRVPEFRKGIRALFGYRVHR